MRSKTNKCAWTQTRLGVPSQYCFSYGAGLISIDSIELGNAIIYTPCPVFAYSVTTDPLRKHSYVLRLVVVNIINEPLEIGPGPVFKATCNVTNQLSKSVPGCSEVKKINYFWYR